MEQKKITAGNKDAKLRSDCFVSLELTTNKHIDIQLNSKVEVMYGNAIRKLINDELSFFGITSAKIIVHDAGALDFTLSARIEAVIKQVIDTKKCYLPKLLPENTTQSTKEQFRFSRLYLPGNTPSIMLNAGLHKPNAIILDLEDAVAPSKKYEATILVRNALRAVNFYGAERMVRINQLPAGLNDIKLLAQHHVNLFLIPKCESANQIMQVDSLISELRKEHNFTYPIFYMPIIESALGVEKAFEIATASKNVAALAIGLEDYTANLGTQRTTQGDESFFARTRIVNACKAAGIQPIDSVFSDVANENALRKNVKISISLGFEGMGCIHPRQITPIHQSFAPSEEQIEKAKIIVTAYEQAKEKGLGVISIGTKMIDAPVVKRAISTINLAKSLDLI